MDDTELRNNYAKIRAGILTIDDNGAYSGRDVKKMLLDMLDLAELNLKFAKDNERILDKVIKSTKQRDDDRDEPANRK